MRELLTLVPADDAPWPAAARTRWMAAFAAVADVVYEDGHLFTGSGHAPRVEVAPADSDAPHDSNNQAHPGPPSADPQLDENQWVAKQLVDKPWVDKQSVGSADALDITALELGRTSVDLRVNRGAAASGSARHRRPVE